jgi:hypothetical protein
MPTFYVILEDIPPPYIAPTGKPIPRPIENKRVVELDAKNLDEAWLLARMKWYFRLADGRDPQVDIQIADILAQPPEPTPPPAMEQADAEKEEQAND